jgi:hypothetical protein
MDFPWISHRPQDVLWDLGCGDGVVLIEAAKRCGCRCVGLDIDQPWLRQKWWLSPWFWNVLEQFLGRSWEDRWEDRWESHVYIYYIIYILYYIIYIYIIIYIYNIYNI